MHRPLTATLIAAVAALLTGCAGPSVWERSFEAEPAAGPMAASGPALVRDAPWERVNQALAAEREAIAASDVHRSEWTAEQAEAVERRLLSAIQLPAGQAETARLLGRSSFRTTRTIDPDSGELAAFAGSIGADHAIWTRRLLGKAETVEREPVFIDGYRSVRVWDDDRGRHVYQRRFETDTVWVPVVVERDEVLWVVFYVDTQ